MKQLTPEQLPKLCRYLSLFNYSLNHAIYEVKSSKSQFKEIFNTIFTEDGAPHFISKLQQTFDFGSFYLNLDTTNQIKVLKYIFSEMSVIGDDEISYDFPEVENWEQKCANFSIPTDIDKEDQLYFYRQLAVGEDGLTEWDLYPEIVVFIHKWFLYANNTNIESFIKAATIPIFIQKLNYSGSLFGNIDNWLAFYICLNNCGRELLVETLINYK